MSLAWSVQAFVCHVADDDTPPWEAKKKAAQKQAEPDKAEILGAPWEKKKQQQPAEEKSSSAPWENKKDGGKGLRSKKPEETDSPPWQQKEVKKEVDDSDVGTPPWQQREQERDKALGPPPWVQQQQQQQQQRKVTPEKPRPLLDFKQERFESRKRPLDESPVKPRCAT